MEACVNSLLDELQQAVAWSRPSLLLAVHQLKNDQPRAIAAMERTLAVLPLNVEHINPENEQVNLLHGILRRRDLHDTVFFILGLGSRLEIYSGLNLYRELVVERRLKLIFWLTVDEMVALSQRAPDFWAFRHRVIEFPRGRASRQKQKP